MKHDTFGVILEISLSLRINYNDFGYFDFSSSAILASEFESVLYFGLLPNIWKTDNYQFIISYQFS